MFQTILPANLDALEPGPVLDALVAGHICGYRWYRTGDAPCRYLQPADYDGDPLADGSEEDTSECAPPPHYSTDPNAAIGLLESLTGVCVVAAWIGNDCEVSASRQHSSKRGPPTIKPTFAHAAMLALLKFKAAGGVVAKRGEA